MPTFGSGVHRIITAPYLPDKEERPEGRPVIPYFRFLPFLCLGLRHLAKSVTLMKRSSSRKRSIDAIEAIIVSPLKQKGSLGRRRLTVAGLRLPIL